MTSRSLSECVRALDGTDLHILELLAEGARRPFSDISAEVGLSAPAVSDHTNHLRKEDIVRRFTVNPDQSTFSGGTSVLVRLSVRSELVDRTRDALRTADPVQHLFVAADGEVTTHAQLGGGSVRAQSDELVDLSRIHDYEASLMKSMEWSPTVSGTGFVFERAECGNTMTSEGGNACINGSFYCFRCSFCLDRFEDRYDHLGVGANDD